MKKEEAKEIIDCMPDDRTLIHYHKDHYAAWLLAEIAGQGVDIAELKRSAYGRLLSKPLIKSLLAARGNGRLCANDFEYVWQEPSKTFMLTLDTWDGSEPQYDQTTRAGVNLVLQLNFSNQHNGYFHNSFANPMQDDLRSYGHPTLQPGKRKFKHETLAWARIDLDMNTGEALIEEIQNDWLRYAKDWKDCLVCESKCRWCLVDPYIHNKYDEQRIRHYLDEVLAPYYDLWCEAMLYAAIWFLHKELGVHKIYYHTHESGAKLKSIDGDKPPRSLYTKLPKQFCFQPTSEHPTFLQDDRYFRRRLRRNRHLEVQWQFLDLEKSHAAA